MGLHGRSSASLAAALLGVLALAPAAMAGPAVEHDSTVVTEVPGASNANGVLEPGESADVTERVISAEFDPLTGVTGDFSTSAPGVSDAPGPLSWPDLFFGTPAGSLAPERVSLAADAPCGAPVPLQLTLHTPLGDAAVPVTVPTGATGAWTATDSTQVPVVVPDLGTITSSVTLTGSGLAKGIRVRIGELDHPQTRDLRIELIGPDGRSVILADGRGGSGSGYLNTVFDDAATTSIWSGSVPFTGSFQPQQPLSTLAGEPVAGTWSLRVSDRVAGDSGALIAWGLDVAPAVCQSATPPPPPSTDTTGTTDPTPTPTPTATDDDGDGPAAQPPHPVHPTHPCTRKDARPGCAIPSRSKRKKTVRATKKGVVRASSVRTGRSARGR